MFLTLSLALSILADPVPVATTARPAPSAAPAPATPTTASCADPRLSGATFDRLDRDGDGVLTRADTRRRWMGRARANRAGVDPVLHRLDRDGDGRVSRAEIAANPSACPADAR